ncbi:hypothetical protein [uncultured Brachyspira sp.]|uniref:hypothetical protein n=1 Tax=uncultured Brachyspira sp. TaxID=221953 RepID=UPI002615947A|nr:hypothetical protein [uncultured Brachyspira sp.]
MKKNKLYIFIILLLIIIISCSGNNIRRGILHSQAYTDISFEVSRMKAEDAMYYYIAEQTASLINRNDFNIVAVSLKDNNLIDFSNEDIVTFKEYKKDDNFYTEIKLKDDTIYDRTIEVLNRLKKEGSIDDKIFRANASIEISENAKLNAYTRQMLTQNALKRAYESLFKVLLSNNIEVNKAVSLTNEAYILEESYSSNEYNVVVETIDN